MTPPTYKVSIWYRATPDGGTPQTYSGLTRREIENWIRPEVGFMSDLLNLEGEGVRKLTLEVER